MTRYFIRITLANLPYALWLSLRGPVAAWKVEVPARLAKRFARIRPYRIWSRDEWLLAHDQAFDLWRDHAFPLIASRVRHTRMMGERPVDFSRNLWQLLGAEFEALAIFTAMLAKASRNASYRPCVIAPRIAAAFTDDELESLFPRIHFIRSTINRLLDNQHEWYVSLAHLGRELVHLLGSFVKPRISAGDRPIAWLGISPQEIADRDGMLDFAWAVRHGHAQEDEVIYFGPQRLTPAQRGFCASQRIVYVEPGAVLGLLPPGQRLRAVARGIAAWAKALVSGSGLSAALIARLLVRARIWDALFEALGTRTYVTTTSYSWPEKPEVAVATSRGIRTIIWAYSANSLTFTIDDPSFRDLGIARSVVIADEFWVWNRAYAAWLANRRIEGNCVVRLTGPLMCGDGAILTQRRKAAARERLEVPPCTVCIGVFDMPPITDAWRDRFGGGPPMVDTPTYIEFWEIVERVITRVPGACAIIKMKRDFDHVYREFPEVLRRLVDPAGEHVRAGRLHRVDVNVDPYLPVAACDVAIGVAYTSPVLAARAAGIPGYYLDPLRKANYPSSRDYALITLHTEDDVVRAVTDVVQGRGHLVPAPEVTPAPMQVPLHEPATNPA